MECPRCKTAPLKTRTRDAIEVDVCERCGGVWLDRGELEKILDSERAQRDADARDNWRQYDRGRDGYDPTPAPVQEKGLLESVLGTEDA